MGPRYGAFMSSLSERGRTPIVRRIQAWRWRSPMLPAAQTRPNYNDVSILSSFTRIFNLGDAGESTASTDYRDTKMQVTCSAPGAFLREL